MVKALSGDAGVTQRFLWAAGLAFSLCVLCLITLADAYDLTPWSGSLPGGAVEGGEDSDGGALFICVASRWGGQHPGSLSSAGMCSVAWGGEAHSLDADFQVLVGAASWVHMPDGGIPDRAFVAGDDGGPLYVCRALTQGGLYPGRLNAEGWCYIAAGGVENVFTEAYEVLVE
jgi:hypothetical protein